MKRTALLVVALSTLTAVTACGKKPEPQPPMAPPPVAPEPPPPAPPPARQEVAPQVDEYARLKAMSVEEIAQVTGVTRETAKSRLRYALAKLRATLGTQVEQEPR